MVVLRGFFARAGCAADGYWSNGPEKGSWRRLMNGAAMSGI